MTSASSSQKPVFLELKSIQGIRRDILFQPTAQNWLVLAMFRYLKSSVKFRFKHSAIIPPHISTRAHFHSQWMAYICIMHTQHTHNTHMLTQIRAIIKWANQFEMLALLPQYGLIIRGKVKMVRVYTNSSEGSQTVALWWCWPVLFWRAERQELASLAEDNQRYTATNATYAVISGLCFTTQLLESLSCVLHVKLPRKISYR